MQNVRIITNNFLTASFKMVHQPDLQWQHCSNCHSVHTIQCMFDLF